MKMGVSIAYPIADLDGVDGHFGAALVRSISFSDGDHETERTASRAHSFNGRDSEPSLLRKQNSSTKMKIKRSPLKRVGLESMLSFETPRAELENQVFGQAMSFEDAEAGEQSHSEGMALESKLSFKTATAELENQVFSKATSFKDAKAGNQSSVSHDFHDANSHLPWSEQGNRRYEAALKLQKVYKSFRTRRRLADCAVLAEQRWWRVLDFAELKRSSISFFDIDKNETALSRWSRARTRAAKVGKGLSKDEKARKLALQHWLEAIDPRHRYGHNLQFYYVNWLHCESKQPFFYWLDIGDGKEVNLERCPRSKLHQQCIKYLGPIERVEYEVVIEDSRFIYTKSGKVLDTTGGPKYTKWIFVLSASKTLYVGQKSKGKFQHSSFLAGGATLSAGRLVVEDGTLKAVWPYSGHYLPTQENFEAFMSFLEEHNVDLTNVKKCPDEEEEEFTSKKSLTPRSSLSGAEISRDAEEAIAKTSAQGDIDSRKQDPNSARNTAQLPEEEPTTADVVDSTKVEALLDGCCSESPESSSEDGYETAEESLLSEEEFMVPKKNLFEEGDAEEIEKPVPKEKIMKRIDSHKGTKSYQLAQQLSSKWSTGAGPRIGCMRDYPSELQFQVLEQAHLSPRSIAPPHIRSSSCPKVFAPSSSGRSLLAQ